MSYPAPYISQSYGKDPNDTAIILNRFNQAKDADWENRRRGIRNMAAYLNDILPNHLKNALRLENRTEQNFNILMYIVRGHVGNTLMNWFDPKFTGREDVSINSIDAFTKTYIAQKEYYDYKASAMSCYENGYIYRGVEQLILDRPNSNPRSWGLKFVSMRPDRVIFDQNNDSDKISRNSQEAWIIHYMTPEKMIRFYGAPQSKVERNILFRLRDESKEAPAFDTPTRDLYDTLDRSKYGNAYRVIEWPNIVYEKKSKQFLKNGREIPSSGYEIGTVEDARFKQEWAQLNGFVLSNDMILTMTDYVPCMYTTAFAPDLGIQLDNRKDFRQLNGHLPLYAWSFMQKNGVSMGIVDYEWDIQQDFNKREIAKTKIITKTPIAGKPWLRRDMFESEELFNDAVKNYNDPSVPLVVPENAPPIPEGFGIIPGAQFPPSILQDENFKLLLSERIGMLPPAIQGRSERSADSGVAIGRKVVEANVMMKQESVSIVQHENDKHEDWVTLGIKLFGHPININRTFQSADGKDVTIINEPVGIDSVGNTVLRNDIAALKNRVGVIISQAKENDFVSQIRVEKSVASLQAMVPSDTNILTRAAMEYTLATNMDYSTDEEKERVKRLADLQLEIAETQGMVQLGNLKKQLPGQAPQGGSLGQGAPPAQSGLPAPPQNDEITSMT